MGFTRLHIWLNPEHCLSTCLVEATSLPSNKGRGLHCWLWHEPQWDGPENIPASAQVVPWMFKRNRNKVSVSLQYRAQLLLLLTAKVSWKCSFGKDSVDFVGFWGFFNHLKSRKQQKQVNMFIDWSVRQEKLYFAPLRTNMNTMGKHTTRTSKFNFLSKQTRQGKDYPLLGAASAKFTADWNCSTFPLRCVYLRLHIKIRYAKVKIAAHIYQTEDKAPFHVILFKYTGTFQTASCWDQFPASPYSSSSVPSGKEWDVLVVTSCRGKKCTHGAGAECWKQLKTFSSPLNNVTSFQPRSVSIPMWEVPCCCWLKLFLLTQNHLCKCFTTSPGTQNPQVSKNCPRLLSTA